MLNIYIYSTASFNLIRQGQPVAEKVAEDWVTEDPRPKQRHISPKSPENDAKGALVSFLNDSPRFSTGIRSPASSSSLNYHSDTKLNDLQVKNQIRKTTPLSLQHRQHGGICLQGI